MDIESERRCQVDMSIKMIQSRARCSILGVCGVKYHIYIYKAFIILIQTDISNSLTLSLNWPQIDLPF